MARNHRSMHLRNQDGSGRGVLRHVGAVVSRTFADRFAHDGGEHQHIWIEEVRALDGGEDYDGEVFVAIRITEGGIGQDIPFEIGQPVEVQGDWIDSKDAIAGQDDPGLPVIHFTHRPVGFVIYDGVRYA